MNDVVEVYKTGLTLQRRRENAAGPETAGPTQLLSTRSRNDPSGIIPSNERDNPLDLLLRDGLAFIGVALLAEWDTLIFLYRHGLVLATAARLARLLSLETAKIDCALDRLESLKLIEPSRSSAGIRFYKVMPAGDSRHRSFRQLLGLTQNRAGRLNLLKILKSVAPKAALQVCSATFSRKGVSNVR